MYDNYPVVGVTWEQARLQPLRTRQRNELLLNKNGYLDFSSDQQEQNNFNTGAYLRAHQGAQGKKTIKTTTLTEKAHLSACPMVYIFTWIQTSSEVEWEYAALCFERYTNSIEGEEAIAKWWSTLSLGWCYCKILRSTIKIRNDDTISKEDVVTIWVSMVLLKRDKAEITSDIYAKYAQWFLVCIIWQETYLNG